MNLEFRKLKNNPKFSILPVGRQVLHPPFSILLFFIIFSILHSPFYIQTAPAKAQIPLSPLQPELQDEILGTARTAAVLGVPALEELDIRVYAMRLVKGALLFIGLIVIIMLIYGGFTYMTAAGNDEKIEKAVKTITRAAIGTGIVLSSYAIVFFVSRTLQRTIFQNLNTQLQNCSTQGGQATCCQEFAAFQNAGRATFDTLADPGRAALGREISEQGQRNQEIQRQLYDEWRACVNRSNPF